MYLSIFCLSARLLGLKSANSSVFSRSSSFSFATGKMVHELSTDDEELLPRDSSLKVGLVLAGPMSSLLLPSVSISELLSGN